LLIDDDGQIDADLSVDEQISNQKSEINNHQRSALNQMTQQWSRKMKA
jgi:hypothetical protein